jgi:hypothetical protein
MDYKKDAEIEVQNVAYIKNENGFADVLHGKYVVHVHSDNEDSEFVMMFYKCPSGSTGLCKDNEKIYTENLDCKRFLTDPSGPWFMFAPAMDPANVCAKKAGDFDFNGAHLNATFVEKYMTVEEGHYRIRMINHVPGKDMDVKNLRACIELDFDIKG